MKVGVLMGSATDSEKMAQASETLERFGIEADVRVLSAHRNPDQVVELVSTARENGYVAFICGAGMAAHLAGVVAAHTTLPVVGVPMSGGALNGVDALYSTVQMPKGIPVATVAIDGSMNAALLVVEMLAISDEGLAKQLAEHREEIAKAKDPAAKRAELVRELVWALGEAHPFVRAPCSTTRVDSWAPTCTSCRICR